MNAEEPPVPVELYTEEYFLTQVGGAEFFARYGAEVLKPALAYALDRAQVEEGMTALDLGCGRGELLYQLKRRGVRAVGADVAPAALAIAKKTSGAEVVRCDAKKLPFEASSFDRIFFLGVLDHLHDWELEQAFAEFKRTLRPGGLVLADTCTNKEYHKNLTYELRRRWAAKLGLKEPSPPRSQEDHKLHVNEHDETGLESFFRARGWRAEIEPKPTEKHLVRRLYGDELPRDFPIKPAPIWKSVISSLALSGPWKRFFAREWFCRLRPN